MMFGADVSTLELIEELGGRFYKNGREENLLRHLKDAGCSDLRLRLWNDPRSPEGESYGGGDCDIGRVCRTARRGADYGMSLLLDIHYSDFWADPGRQLPPLAWRGLGLEALCGRVYDFTCRTLETLDKNGTPPHTVAVGNEITNGLLWPCGQLTGDARSYDALAALLTAGARAVRESSDARVMLHLESSGDAPRWRQWLDAAEERGVPFDLIGASYYPYWHGGMDALRENLSACALRYKRDIYIVETSYPFTTVNCPLSQGAPLCISDGARKSDGSPVEYPLTREGQADFFRDLLALCAALPEGRGKGVYWWEPGWLPLEGSGWATPAALRYAGEEQKPLGNEWANQCLFDYSGNANPALDVFQYFDRQSRLK